VDAGADASIAGLKRKPMKLRNVALNKPSRPNLFAVDDDGDSDDKKDQTLGGKAAVPEMTFQKPPRVEEQRRTVAKAETKESDDDEESAGEASRSIVPAVAPEVRTVSAPVQHSGAPLSYTEDGVLDRAMKMDFRNLCLNQTARDYISGLESPDGKWRVPAKPVQPLHQPVQPVQPVQQPQQQLELHQPAAMAAPAPLPAPAAPAAPDRRMLDRFRLLKIEN
jgi:hypothetical protein